MTERCETCDGPTPCRAHTLWEPGDLLEVFLRQASGWTVLACCGLALAASGFGSLPGWSLGVAVGVALIVAVVATAKHHQARKAARRAPAASTGSIQAGCRDTKHGGTLEDLGPVPVPPPSAGPSQAVVEAFRALRDGSPEDAARFVRVHRSAGRLADPRQRELLRERLVWTSGAALFVCLVGAACAAGQVKTGYQLFQCAWLSGLAAAAVASTVPPLLVGGWLRLRGVRGDDLRLAASWLERLQDRSHGPRPSYADVARFLDSTRVAGPAVSAVARDTPTTRCPFCHADIGPGDLALACDRCGAPHHANGCFEGSCASCSAPSARGAERARA